MKFECSSNPHKMTFHHATQQRLSCIAFCTGSKDEAGGSGETGEADGDDERGEGSGNKENEKENKDEGSGDADKPPEKDRNDKAGKITS